MPAIHQYEVEQTRAIHISATSPEDAMILASREFAKELTISPIVPENEIKGHALSSVEITRVDISKRY